MSALREKESEILTSLSNSPKSLSELAEELGAGFSKTTVHRIVTSLREFPAVSYSRRQEAR